MCRLLTIACCALLSGCGTIESLSGGNRQRFFYPPTPPFGLFSGVRTDVAVLADTVSPTFKPFALVDLPFSLALDTVLLPVSCGWYLFGPEPQRPGSPAPARPTLPVLASELLREPWVPTVFVLDASAEMYEERPVGTTDAGWDIDPDTGRPIDPAMVELVACIEALPGDAPFGVTAGDAWDPGPARPAARRDAVTWLRDDHPVVRGLGPDAAAALARSDLRRVVVITSASEAGQPTRAPASTDELLADVARAAPGVPVLVAIVGRPAESWARRWAAQAGREVIRLEWTVSAPRPPRPRAATLANE